MAGERHGHGMLCVNPPLGIRHAIRMCRIILPSVACLALPYFTHDLIKATILGGKMIEHKICVLIFSTTFEAFLILRRIQRDIIKDV